MGVRESSPGKGKSTVYTTTVYQRLDALENEVGTGGSTLAGKADKTYVDGLTGDLSQLTTTDKSNLVNAIKENVSALADKATKAEVAAISASPKGVYATVSALQTAFPTGNSNIYIVSADGNWYYWNGSAWTAGGTYQATGLSANSVAPENINNTLLQDNSYFVSANVIANSYIDGTGTVVSNANFAISDYIPVNQAQKIIYNALDNSSAIIMHQGAYYDTNKNWISEIPKPSSMPVTITIPSNVAFIRLNFGNGTSNSSWVNKQIISIPWLNITSNNLDSGIITSKNISTSILNDSSFFTINETDGTYIDGTGTLVSNANFNLSDYIPVNPGQIVQYNALSNEGSIILHQGGYFDSNKNWISEIPAPDAMPNAITVPNNAYFLRLNFGNYSGTTSWVNKQKTVIPWVTVTKDNLDDELKKAINSGVDKWSGKIANFIGDSITYGYSLTDIDNEKFSALIAKDLNMTCNNYGVPGTKIAVVTGDTDSFTQRYSSMADNADIVFVFGGTNDYGHSTVLGNGATSDFGSFTDRTETTFYGALHVLYKGLIQKYLGKQIVVITPMHRYGMNGGDDFDVNPTTYKTLQDYVNAERQVAEYYGITVLDFYKEMPLNPMIPEIQNNYMPDKLHPNSYGHRMIADKIIAFMNTI